MIYIVGLGPGNKEYILPKAIEILNSSDKIIGFSRAIDSLEFIKNEKVKVKSLREIIELLNENETISIIASGDPTFYGVTEYIRKKYNGKIEVIPGISSFQYLTCKLGKCWSGSYLGSVHGREDKFIEKVLEHKISIWLTDSKNTPLKLSQDLFYNNIKCKVYVGENLSYKDEKIVEGTPEEIIKNNFGNLSILIVEREI